MEPHPTSGGGLVMTRIPSISPPARGSRQGFDEDILGTYLEMYFLV